MNNNKKEIRTSSPNWVSELAEAYKNEIPVLLIDDANTGIDPQTQNLLNIGYTSNLSKDKWVAVLVSLGLSAAGIGLVVAAILDPEPTSTLAILTAGGTICLFTGGLQAIQVLTRVKPPNVKVSKNGEFVIQWN